MSSITLRGITWKNARGYDPLVAASELWVDKNPHIKIEWDQLPWYEFEDKILGSLAAGDGAYDLIMFDHPWTGKMASEKWLIPWDKLSTKEYLNNLLERVVTPSTESYELYGHQWALPLDGSCHAGIYRNDLVDGSNLPRTWETISKWAASYHNPPHCYALVICLEGVLGSCLFLSMMAGLGHPPYIDERAPTCNRDAASYVLTTIKNLLSFTPPGSSRLGPWDIYERFCSRDDVAYSPSIFAYVNYFGKGLRRENLRMCRVPDFANGHIGRPILGGVGLGIAHTCPYTTEAKIFGEFLMSEAVQREIFPKHSGQPSTRNSWMDPEINIASNDFYMNLYENMTTAYIRPRYAAFHHIELEIGKTLQLWWDEELSLNQTLDKLSQIKK